MRRRIGLLCAATMLFGSALHAQDQSALPSLDYLQMEDPAEPPVAGEPRLETDMPASEDTLSAPKPVLAPEPVAAPEPIAPPTGEPRSPREIEDSTGGRMGVALVDSKGRLLLGFNRQDRYALCSTFKAPLAAAILAKSDTKALGRKVKFSRADMIDHSPTLKKNEKTGQATVEQLLQGIVELSDNGAANLLLPLAGGPEGLTKFMRAHGDGVSRLDRTEPTLNENAVGDPRDTTSPEAMATLMAKLLYEDLSPAAAKKLAGWMTDSPTGAKRIRAGLPEGWSGGSKTGTCGNAYNDVGFIRSPAGENFVLAVYLDRPTVSGPQSEAAIAEIARAVSMLLSRRVPPAENAPAPVALDPMPRAPVLPDAPSAPPPPSAPRSVLTTPDTR